MQGKRPGRDPERDRQRRSERRWGWGLLPDACPASRWMERKRSCLQNQSLSQSQSPSPRKPSEWPWSPRGLAPIVVSLLDREHPEVTLCLQHHPDQAGAKRRGFVKGSGEMNVPLLLPSLPVGCSLRSENFLPCSSWSSSSLSSHVSFSRKLALTHTLHHQVEEGFLGSHNPRVSPIPALTTLGCHCLVTSLYSHWTESHEGSVSIPCPQHHSDLGQAWSGPPVHGFE